MKLMPVDRKWQGGGVMTNKILVHKSFINIHGNDYPIMVYSCPNGRHSAETALGANDIIINDAGSLEEVLVKHKKLLPLAVYAHGIRQRSKGVKR